MKFRSSAWFGWPSGRPVACEGRSHRVEPRSHYLVPISDTCSCIAVHYSKHRAVELEAHSGVSYDEVLEGALRHFGTLDASLQRSPKVALRTLSGTVVSSAGFRALVEQTKGELTLRLTLDVDGIATETEMKASRSMRHRTLLAA